mgnify:CR=1 FL=1
MTDLYKKDENLVITINEILKWCNSISRENVVDKSNDFCSETPKKNFTNRREATDFLRKGYKISEINTEQGLMTGYYEPELKAYTKPGKNRFPIYGNPKILGDNSLLGLTRKEINRGLLKDKGLEIAWVENEIEAFFLHIQGSGRLKFDNMEIKKVRFSGSNKKKYSSIGKILVRKGLIDKKNISMYSIKNWLKKNPLEARNIMEKNNRYIFFEIYEGGVKGSSMNTLLPNISIAVDTRYIPLGTPLIIQEQDNKKNIFLALAHDTGNAIKGKQRIDLFTGFGKNAEKKAAFLKSKIKVWILKAQNF